MSWAERDEFERAILLLASEEGDVWEICGYWPPGPDGYTTHNLERMKGVVARMMRDGLIWFFWRRDDSPDLTDPEVVEVFNDSRWWIASPDSPRNVALYLTRQGEREYYQPDADSHAPIRPAHPLGDTST